MKKTFWISTPNKRYAMSLSTDLAIWDDVLRLPKKYPSSRVFLITDSHLYAKYKDTLTELSHAGITIIRFPAGEHSKNQATKDLLERKLFQANCNRQDILIAFGGGVVGDLVGFVAATYMRGIRYIAIPTSIIGMVDSSIGGKNGIDTPYGKNLIGTFYHPEAIWTSIAFLQTLPPKDYLSGFAEVAKYAFICNLPLYRTLLKRTPDIHSADPLFLIKIISLSIRSKIQVVTHDERETGYRRILNFGHTFGHALEHLSGYAISHGAAVSLGMTLEAWLSYREGILSELDFTKIIQLLRAIGLPTLPHELPNPKARTACKRIWHAQKLYTTMCRDKKSTASTIRFNALKRIGAVHSNKGSFVIPLHEDFFNDAFALFNQTFKIKKSLT